MPTTIIYKGATIAELQAGSIGTLSCNGKEMESDIVVVAPDSEGGGTSADERVLYVTFMNGATELISYPVIVGDTVKNPATAGLIDTPTKEQTVSTVYTFSGWSLTDGGSASSSALTNVTEDRTVYAAFRESARLYTVYFYDGDTLVNTEQVGYGSSSTYTYAKDDYIFTGWSPEPTNITGDLDCYAQWIEGVEFSQASVEKIMEIADAGLASTVFNLGDTRTFTFTREDDGAEVSIDMQIVAFNHDTLSDGTGTAAITLVSVPCVKWVDDFGTSYRKLDSGYETSPLRTWLEGTFMESLFPQEWKPYIKQVTKKTHTKTATITTEDYAWLPGKYEMGYSEYQPAYEYFRTQANRIKDGFSSSADSSCWKYLLRDSGKTDSFAYAVAMKTGEIEYDAATFASSIGEFYAFGFCI